MNRPLVSVCCITYNHELYIRQALEGFVMQRTTFPIEILIHDDASTDQTASIIREYAAKDSRIHAILRTNNLKSTGVHIYPILYEMAQGKYIALCEGDDYWTDPLKLQKQVDFLESHPDYSICFHPTDLLDQQSNQIMVRSSGSSIPQNTRLIDLAQNGNYINTVSLVAKNPGKLPTYVSQLPIGDYPLLLHLAKQGSIHRLVDTMAVYRIHPKGIWTQTSQETKHLKALDYIDKILSYDNYEKEVLKAFSEQLASHNLALMNIYWETDRTRALHHYNQCIKLHSHLLFEEILKVKNQLKELNRPLTLSSLAKKILIKIKKVFQ